MKICTFNIKNNYNQYQKEKAKDIVDFIDKNNIDILCTQELFDICKNDINNYLSRTNYKIYGKYRFKLNILRKINESVSIITNQKVISNETFHLPYLPSLLKRIATKLIIKIDNYGEICILNTHIDFKYDLAKKRQLKKLLNIITDEKRPIIITGDFNLKNNNPIFNGFVDNLEKLGIKRVPINEKTLKQSKYKRAIDHIFISNDFELKKVNVIKDLEISDHYPVLIDIEVINKGN